MLVRKPKRASRSYTQRLVAGPERVFPLLCPVREAEWIEGWDPLLVLSETGVAERDCVFHTAGKPADTVWYVTRHEPEAGFVEMVRVTPGLTACRLTIGLRAAGGGCEADVTYAHTSLGPEGDAFIDAFTEDAYRGFMRDWETRLNHFLRHGTAMKGPMR